jgi:succinate dehydrogenase / fumarate reductase flavoprotein subunit
MGGVWVDYNMLSNIEGLFVIGEANFADQGANRLGASALMQGLADGYFILPYTLGDYLARVSPADRLPPDHPAFRQIEQEATARIEKLLSADGKRTADSFHRELGDLLWNDCGMSRNAAGLGRALARVPELREEFWSTLKIAGVGAEMNQTLEHAGRVADFLEFAELLCHDALNRDESCGAHFRQEHQTPEGEALRDDEHFSHVSAWEFTGLGRPPTLHKEPLAFECVKPTQRSYK